jgi:hypothetical protein
MLLSERTLAFGRRLETSSAATARLHSPPLMLILGLKGAIFPSHGCLLQAIILLYSLVEAPDKRACSLKAFFNCWTHSAGVFDA